MTTPTILSRLAVIISFTAIFIFPFSLSAQTNSPRDIDQYNATQASARQAARLAAEQQLSTLPSVTDPGQAKLLPPSNDECTGAVLITQNSGCTYTTGTVLEATQSQPGCSGTANEDVWFKFMANQTSAKIKVQGSVGFDAVFEVFSGSCGNLTGISCMDNTFAGGLEVALVGNLTIGQMYYIRVYDYETGLPLSYTFDICVTEVFHCIPSIPGATAEIEACGANINGGCDLATPYFQTLVPGETVTGDAWSNNLDRDRDWFKFHLSTATPILLTMIPEFPVELSLMSYNNCISSPILKTTMGPACDTTYLADTLAAGDYVVFVANQTYNGYPCGTNNFYVLKLNATNAQNDICVNAIPVQCGSSYEGSTLGATVDAVPICNGVNAGAAGVWFLLPGNNKIMTASLCNVATYNTILQVYSGNCGSLTCVTANDDFCATKSQVEWFAVTGTDYYIFVNGAALATGNFHLDLSCTCPPPADASLTGNTANSVNLMWTQIGNPSSWDIEAGTPGFTQSYNADFTGLTNPGVINGLPSDRDFDFYVRSVCGVNDYSDWIGPFFMHTRCPAPDIQLMGVYLDSKKSHINHITPANSTQLADDFTVPAGECWIIDGVTLSYLGTTIDSLHITFYNNSSNLPGTAIATETHPTFVAVPRGSHLGMNAWELYVNMTTPVTLCGGASGTRYWIGSQGINASGAFWETQNTDIRGLEAAFINPGGGVSSCTSWSPLSTCFGSAADASFRILRTENIKPDITCPHDTILNIISGTSVPFSYAINATDNCLADTIYRIQGLASGASFPIGITTNRWVTKDPAGNSDTCSFTVTVNLVLSTDDLPEFTAKVYPNPVTDLLNIELGSAFEGSRISLYSIEGKLIKVITESSTAQKMEVSMQEMRAGVYYVRFETRGGVYFNKVIRH